MMNDILHALDNGNVTLLDLLAAFDTTDHDILSQRPEQLYGTSGTPLNWFRSYLSNRMQTVTVNSKLSQLTLLKFGVPQGSVLGPILFNLYTKPLTTLILQHSISNQSFADDTQLHDSCSPDQIDISVQSMQDCISDVKTWTSSILFHQVLQNIFLTNSKRSKFLQPDLSSKLISMNTSNTSFRNFAGYQQSQESSIKSQLCATIFSLKVTQSIFLNY